MMMTSFSSTDCTKIFYQYSLEFLSSSKLPSLRIYNSGLIYFSLNHEQCTKIETVTYLYNGIAGRRRLQQHQLGMGNKIAKTHQLLKHSLPKL